MKDRRLIEKLLNLNKQQKHYVTFINFICLVSITFLVYFTGGIKYSYSHTMYIPIIFIGIVLGRKWGVSFGIMAGLLLGPLMPYATESQEQQIFINWFFRLIIFTIVGFFSGNVSDALRDYIKNLIRVTNHHYITNIPNIYSLRDVKISNYNRTVVAVHINNYNSIINLLGQVIYTLLLNEIYDILKAKLPSDNTIIQADSNKFWITFPTNNLQTDVNQLVGNLSHFLVIKDIPLYVEYSVGANNYIENKDYLDPKTYQVADDFAQLATKKNLPSIVYSEGVKLPIYDIDLLSSFNKAIELEELFVDYQPKIDLITNKVSGFEALVRWQHPVRGLLMPDEFVPLLEETQLIDDLTYYVIKKVIKKVEEFKEKNIDICISINLSIKNLYNKDFVDNMLKIIKKSVINHNSIEFEVTESILIDNICIMQINKLYEEGYKISLDDYGKGYSSLRYLSDIKFNKLKLDKHFIINIDENEVHQKIVKSTIDLVHNLGHKVIAEGIETKVASEIVKKLNCDYGQGYYYARPLNASKVIDWFIDYHALL